MFRILLAILILTPQFLMAQNLNEERIWKIVGRKKSVYLGSGIFHLNQGAAASTITNFRNSYNPSQGFERLVIDFNKTIPPKLYGHISVKNKKIMVDFFDTSLPSVVAPLKNSKFVKTVDFLAIDPTQVTMEISLKENTNFDIFYLENPGRLVIDIRL